MFLAFAASLRSADLSRQVGAVVARDDEILSTGANDCPKAGGGLYWPYYDKDQKAFVDYRDGRDYMRGGDSNKRAQVEIIKEIGEKCTSKLGLTGKQLKELEKILTGSRIGNITEYGRVVHAEMEALLSCARKGLTPMAATIYCTTFPCHNCAKHIIAAGIERVVFVEPYLKSKATYLHDEVIRIEYPTPAEDSERIKKTVRFEPFFGVGPRRFFDLFSMSIGAGSLLERKEKSGDTTKWNALKALPRVQMSTKSYLDVEEEAAWRFDEVAT